jgi:hypothetical protein
MELPYLQFVGTQGSMGIHPTSHILHTNYSRECECISNSKSIYIYICIYNSYCDSQCTNTFTGNLTCRRHMPRKRTTQPPSRTQGHRCSSRRP